MTGRLVLLGALIMALAVFSSRSSAEAVEKLAIDFEATTLEGRVFDGSRLKGHVVLLDFWAVWCPPCIAAMPTLSRLDHDLGERGFDVVGIAVYSGEPKDVAQFIEDKETTYTVVVGDEDLTERFEVIGFPTYFLLDVDGSIYKMYVGEMKNMKEELEQDIETLLSRTDSKR